MKLFSRSTTDSLAAARQSLDGTEAKIAELEATRGAKLLEADTIADVQRIDQELTTQRQAASIYRDRIAGLVARQRQEQRDRLEAEKADKIAEAEKLITRRDSAALKLEAALTKVREAYAELQAVDQAVFPNGGYLSVGSLLPLCRRDRRPSDPLPRLVIGSVRAIADGAGEGLAAEIRQKGLDLLDLMRAEPIPEIADEITQEDTEVAA
jgi:hypothetical protein